MKKRILFTLALIVSTTYLTLNAQNWNEIINATASDATASDRFGWSVAIDGDYAIVGVPYDDNVAANNNSGSAYIFVNSGGNWVEQAKLTASDGEGGDNFGSRVSINGDYAIVGAPNNDAFYTSEGAAYIFMRTGSNWVEQTKLIASDGAPVDHFGSSVAIDGVYAIVGAYDDESVGSSSIFNSGSAYIFIRSGSNWTEHAKLLASDADYLDRFGASVAIDGDYAIVGAYLNGDSGSYSGSAYIFVRSGSNWTEQTKLTASNAAATDYFGYSVAIDGDYAIVGARNNDESATDSGSAYIFMRSGSIWTEQTKLIASDADAGDYFGNSVSITGNYVIVGAVGYDAAATDSGSAYIFERFGISWVEQFKVTASDAAANDRFGESVSIDGDYVIVGASMFGNSSDSGSAYFYEYDAISADLTNLPDVTSQCEATPTAPTANSGAITATADVTFPITTQGTTIVTWTYDDGIGNTLTQTQNIIINDTTGPSMSFTNPSDATIESCATEVIVPSPQAIEDCLTNDFALDFDGVDDFVSINQAIGSFGTIEFWMYTENGINGSEEFDFIFNFNNSLLQYAGTGNVTSDFAGETFTIVTNFGQLMAITELIPAGWNHIAITGNGSIYDKIILNGVSKPTIGLGTPVVINASSLFIGKRQEDVSSRFLGKLDEIRFWNTPRTEQEVADDFEKIIDASTPNLLAYYDFEDGIGSSILSDKTSTNANGVLTNMNINTDWVTSDAPISSVTLTNDFNGTSDASGTYPEGETTVTWTATDANGNTSTLQQNINVGDTEAPSITFSNPNDASITSCDTNVTITSPLVSDNCAVNTAIDFDGTNDYINLGSPLLSPSNGSQAHTVEMWVKTTPKSAYTILFNQYGWNELYAYRSVFYIDTAANGGNLVFFKGSYVNIEGTTNLLDNQWHHVAMVRENSGELSLYVDGVVEAVGLDTYPYSNTNSLIGGQALLSDNYYSGVMDEVRIWSTARTQTQITNSFNANISDAESGLLAYYKLDDGIGSGVVSDDSSNSNDGVLINMDMNTDWVTSTSPVASVTLTNDFNGTSDASGTYPEGETTVTWTATDPLGNQSTLEQTVNIVCSITYTFHDDVWTPSDPNGNATAIDNLIISSGDANISSNTTVNSVTVEAGASLTLGAALIASDITLHSTASSYSSLLTGASGSASGNISYNRFVNSNSLGNDLVSAPLSGETWSSFLSSENATALLDNGGTPIIYAFAPFDKTTGDYENYDSNTSAILSSGKGYRAATNTGETLTFSGTVPTDASVNIMNTATAYSQWNLVGNPYPSYLNVHAFLNHEVEAGISNLDLFTNASAAIYGYNATTENSWTIYNLANTTASTVIAPGQGFFVSADATHVAAHNLEFTTAMQTAGTSDDFIAGRNADLELIYLTIDLSSNTKTYSTDVYFNANASESLDKGYDADLWGSVVPEFSIYSHLVQDNTGKPIALQTLNAANLANISIPLGVHANLGEQITFSISETTLPATVNVFLVDVLTNISTLLNNSDYIITPSTDLSGTGRFFLRTTEEALSITDNNFDAINIFYAKRAKDVLINGRIQNNTVVEIYDMQGRKVLSSPLDAAVLENRIHVASLNAGVYLVNLKNSLEQKTQKIIIN